MDFYHRPPEHEFKETPVMPFSDAYMTGAKYAGFGPPERETTYLFSNSIIRTNSDLRRDLDRQNDIPMNFQPDIGMNCFLNNDYSGISSIIFTAFCALMFVLYYVSGII